MGRSPADPEPVPSPALGVVVDGDGDGTEPGDGSALDGGPPGRVL
jgi:hypothetical protein